MQSRHRREVWKEEQKAMEAFIHSHPHLVGREEERQAIEGFVESPGGGYLIVSGERGIGKSAFISHLCREFEERFPQKGLFYHFVGVSGKSTNIVFLLNRLFRAFATPEDEIGDDGDYSFLSQNWHRQLSQYPGEIVVVIDGLGELQNLYNARKLFWLPERLPGNVKVIFSLGPGLRKKAVMLRLNAEEIALPPLSREAREQLLSLKADQLGEMPSHLKEDLLSQEATSSPLYLKLALAHWEQVGRPEKLDFPPSLFGLLQQTFSHWEKEWSPEFIQKFLSTLSLARDGMYQEELRMILKPSGQDELEVEEWEKLHRRVQPYLFEQGGRMDFSHGQIGRAVKDRYLQDEELLAKAHHSLAYYFMGRGYDYERTLSELPYHLSYAGSWEVLFWLLAKVDFIESKAKAGMVDELLEDYLRVLDENDSLIPPDLKVEVYSGVEGNWKTLRFIEKSLEGDLAFLHRYPRALFQILWNRAYWHDAPLCALHYEVPEGEIAAWESGKTKLFRLAEAWREKKSESGSSVWLKSRRPLPFRFDSTLVRTLQGHEWCVTSVAFHPQGKEIATGSWDSTIRLWDREKGECLTLLEGAEGFINDLAYSPDGKQLAAASEEGEILIWERETESLQPSLDGHGESIFSLAYSQGGHRLFSGSRDQTICVWDLEEKKKMETLKGHKGAVLALALHPEGEILASGGSDHNILLWDWKEGREIGLLSGHSGWVHSLAFSPDGTRLVSGSEDGTIRVWNVENHESIQVWKDHDSDVTALAFSPDGRRVLSGSRDNSLRLWDVERGNCLLRLEDHDDAVYSVAFSPDGEFVASGSYDHTIRLYDRESVQAQPVLKGHRAPLTCLDASPDEEWIASGARDGTLRIWQMTSGKCLRELSGHSAPLHSVAFSKEGEFLVSRDERGSLKVFQTKTGRLEEETEYHGPAHQYSEDRWGKREPSDSLKVASRAGETLIQSGDEEVAHLPANLAPVLLTSKGVLAGGDEEGNLYILKLTV